MPYSLLNSEYVNIKEVRKNKPSEKKELLRAKRLMNKLIGHIKRIIQAMVVKKQLLNSNAIQNAKLLIGKVI